MVKLRLDRWL